MGAVAQVEASILAVGALAKKAVVGDNGRVAARDTMNLTLVCDHRILYGADGAHARTGAGDPGPAAAAAVGDCAATRCPTRISWPSCVSTGVGLIYTRDRDLRAYQGIEARDPFA